MADYKKQLEARKDDTEFIQQLLSEVNAWDGSFENLQTYYFDEDFFNTFFGDDKMEIARATFFGDIQNWNDDWIRFNAYGNLESLNEYAREKELKEYAGDIMERALELADEINLKEILEA